MGGGGGGGGGGGERGREQDLFSSKSICTIITKNMLLHTPCHLPGFVLLNPTPIMPRKNCYLSVCSLVSTLGKQAVSSGTIKRPVEIALSFLGV